MGQNGPGGKKLNYRQEAAVAACISSHTLAEASQACGVSLTTLKRWMALPEFQEALMQGSRDLLGRAISELLRATSRAAGVLVELLESEHEATRLKAALGILDRSMGAVEYFDIEQRLALVEEQLKHKPRRWT